MTDDARDVQAVLLARCDSSRAAEGHAAFARIYDRHAPVVRALCSTALGPGRSDADDALQETFLRAFRLLHEVTDPDHLRTWMYAIARFVCAERRRSAARRANHEHAAAQEQHMSHLSANQRTTPAVEATRSEQLDRLTTAMDQLADDERLAIHLYYLEPDPVAAAASALGISRSGFYKLLARARTHLASILGGVAS